MIITATVIWWDGYDINHDHALVSMSRWSYDDEKMDMMIWVRYGLGVCNYADDMKSSTVMPYYGVGMHGVDYDYVYSRTMTGFW